MLHRWLLIAIMTAGSLGCVVAQPLAAAQDNSRVAGPLDAVQGMYSFLREGEFVQLTVEDSKLSGFISRFGDSNSDKGQFINQFFDKASLNGDRLSFDTKVVHGVWYQFSGVVSTNADRKPAEEGYRVLKGTLTEHTSDVNGAAGKAMERKVEFKSFPADLSKP